MLQDQRPQLRTTISRGENFMRRFTSFAFLLLAALLVSLPALAQDVISTAIGGGPNGIPALNANLYNPQGVAVDASGNYYIAAFNQNRVFKVAAQEPLRWSPGAERRATPGMESSGGAANASLYHPFAVAVDSTGNIYIADQYNCVVRKVNTARTITTIAGIQVRAATPGTGAKAPSAQLYYPGRCWSWIARATCSSGLSKLRGAQGGAVDRHHQHLRRQPYLRLHRRRRRGGSRRIVPPDWGGGRQRG